MFSPITLRRPRPHGGAGQTLRFAAALALVFASALANAANGIWTGGPGALWTTAATNFSGVSGTPWDQSAGPTNQALFNTAGATPVISGTVFTNGLTFSQTATISGGTLTLAGSTAFTVNAATTLASSLAGTSGLTKAGAAVLTLTGPSAYTGNTTVQNGSVTVSGTGAFTGGGDLTLSTATASPVFNYISTANSTFGTITVSTGSGRSATLNHSAGTISATAVTIATTQNSGGTYNLSGNSTLTLTGVLGVGTRSGLNWYGVFNLSGNASLTASSLNIAPVSGGGSSFGRFDIAGGSASVGGALNLTTGSPSDSTGRIAIASLRGGRLAVSGVTTGSFSGSAYSAALLNFAGGTLVANTANSNFITGLTVPYVYGGGGAIIDTNGQAVTVSKGLLGTSANGVTSVSNIVAGSGYPVSRVNLAVTFSAPDTAPGRSAQGYAVTNASGGVTSISISDPGTGYSTAPVITSVEGGGTGVSGLVTLGLPANLISTGGGLTKRGPGTLTLSGASTYPGPTSVESGSLVLAPGGSILPSASVSVSSGAILENGSGGVLAQNLTLSEGAALRTSAAGSGFAPASSVTFTGDLSDGFSPISLTASAGSGLLKNGSVLRLELTNLVTGTYTLASGSGTSGVHGSVFFNGAAMTPVASGFTLFSGGTRVDFDPGTHRLLIADDADFITLQNRLLTGLYNTSLNPAASLQNLLPDGTFSDLNYVITGSTQFDPHSALQRALTALRAYRSVGNPAYLDPTLRTQINSILTDYAVKNYRSQNWWWHTIGVPLVLADILLLGPDGLSPENLATLIGYAREGLLDISTSRATTPAEGSRSTGANFMDEAMTSYKIFVGARDTVGIETLRQLIEDEIDVFPQGTNTNDWRGEGIQADASFHQHGPMLYSGGYGLSYLNNAFRFVDYFLGTRFQISDRALNVLTDHILDGTPHMGMANGFDYNIAGRVIARVNAIQGRQNQLRYATRLLSQPGVLRRAELTAIEAEGNGGAAPARARHFWDSDYTTQTTQGVFIGVKAFSTRVKPMESISGENVLGYYLSSGSTCVMRTGNEYLNIFPLWNWEKIPGTTALENSLARSDVLSRVNYSYSWRGSTSFVGGVSDGRNAAGTMDQKLPMLFSRKSWFLFDAGLVGVGEGIVRDPADPLLNLSNPGNITTAIEQRFLNGAVTVRDAAGIRTLANGTYLLNSASWVLHDGIGYVFAPGSVVRLKLGPVTGNWNAINTEAASSPVSGDVFLLWLDHGTALTPTSYGYTTLVNADAAKLDAFVAAPSLTTLEATADRHLVWDSTNRLLQAVFRTPGTITTPTGLSLRVSAPCILMARDKTNGGLLLAVSNPLNQAANVVVDVDRQPLAPGGVWNSATPSFTFAVPGGLYAGSSVVFDTDASPLRNASLAVADDGQTVVTFAPLPPATLLWSGQSATWSVGGAANWNNGTAIFYQGDTVTFDGTGVNKTITLSGHLSPGAATFNLASGQNYVVSGAGHLTGEMSLTKTGAGQLTLGGENTYTGDTTLSGGTLSITTTANLGAPAARLIFDGGTLSINGTALTSLSGLGHPVVLNPNRPLGWDIATSSHTFTADLAHLIGTGGLTKSGPGTLVVSLPGNYTGTTVLNQGTLRLLGNQSAVNSTLQIGPSNTSTATLQLGAADQTSPTSLAFGTGKEIRLGQNGYSGSASLALTLAGSATHGTTATNASPLNIYRSSTVTIGSGSTWQQSGNLVFRSVGGFGATLQVSPGGRFLYTGANAIDLGFNNAAGDSGSSRIAIAGGEFTTARAFQLTATTSTSSASVVEFSQGGTLRLSATLAALSTGTAEADNFRLGTGGGVIDTNGFSATLTLPLTGVGGLTKTGAGTFTTTALHTYQGATVVTGGVLALGAAGLSDTAAVSVATGATLSLNFSGIDAVGALTLGGIALPNGTYSASTHPGLLAGTGRLRVGPEVIPSFATWATGLGLSGSAAADFDADGTSDALEYVFGTDPAASSLSPVTLDVANSTLLISFPRADASETTDIALQVESSTDLITWPLIYQVGSTTATSSVGVTIIENGAAPDTVTVAIPFSGETRLFARVKAIVTPTL